MNHFLALDWGKRKIGIAIAGEEMRIAHAHEIVLNDAQFFGVLEALVREHEVDTVLIGIPKHAGHGNAGTDVQIFTTLVATALPDVTVETVDEMFTTKMAQAGRVAAGKKGGDDDAESARILLQEWLDARA